MRTRLITVALTAALLLVGGCGTPKLQSAYDACKKAGAPMGWVKVEDGGNTAELTYSNSAALDEKSIGVQCMFGKMKTSDALLTRMERTTPVAGELSGTSNGLDYKWTYDSDDGLSITVTS